MGWVSCHSFFRSPQETSPTPDSCLGVDSAFVRSTISFRSCGNAPEPASVRVALPSQNADSAGNASHSQMLHANASGVAVWVQAYDLTAAVFLSGVGTTIQ